MQRKMDYSDISYAQQALLPEGLRDQLPHVAEAEAHTIRRLMDVFLSFGYDRVSPPLAEFEESLLVGPGSTKGDSMFRLMDPDSRKVMAIRSDMTPQIARIAATRLRDRPRPLRLAYAGSVLRVKGSQIRPARQFYQAGIELVGASDVAAQLEVIRLAVAALQSVGVADLSVDLTVAPFVPTLCADLNLSAQQTAAVRAAMDARDIGGLEILDETIRPVFEVVLKSAGEAKEAVAALEALNISGHASLYITELAVLTEKLKKALPDVAVTADPGESHGFDYKSGLGFALFSKSVHGELGRGGRYEAASTDGTVEEATGFSMYLDSLMAALPTPKSPDKLFVPSAEDFTLADQYRKEGWRVIQGLTDEDKSPHTAAEIAKKLGCTHIHSNGTITAL